jgi:signal transduction histidine kinase/CheY-like chemotaxis protein
MRIRSRLLLLMLAVLVPATVGSGIGLYYLYAEEQEFNQESMRETARALALVLDREVAQREAILRTLAQSTTLQDGDLRTFHRYAATIGRERDVAIILSDLQGNQLVNSRLPFGAPLPKMLPAERQFRARFGNHATLVSNLYLPPAGLGPHSFAIQVPVRNDEGAVAHFLTMGSYARDLSSLFVDQRFPEEWHATIVDRDGIVVARSRDAERFVGTPVRAELREALTARTEGFHRGIALNGVRGTAFFARAGRSQWTFLISVPDPVLYAPARKATALMGVLALVLLAIALGACWLAARRVAEPVERLRSDAQRLGHNEPVEFEPTGTAELDAVGRALAEASTRLRRNTGELEDRVAQAVESYEQSQRQLVQSQKLEALGRLTGGIAHDFNNVLQTLTAGLEAAKRSPPDKLQDLLARCQRAVARGTELARQLMSFGRVQEVRVVVVNPLRHLFECRSMLEGALPSNVNLDYDLSPDMWPVSVDPAQLELAVLNLVINARDAMPAGGSMVLRGGNRVITSPRQDLPAGDYVVLSLSDTGDGMPPDVVDKALDPFFTTKGVGKGSGMGLPQAYGFARQVGGTLELQSEPGQGTTATLVLPRAAHAPAEAAPPAAVAAPSASRGKVLLVEDDELVRETVSTALGEAGFQIHTAETADEALHRMEAGERFDAVLTDVVMPGTLDGIELAQQIQRRYPGTGIVIATGYTDRRVHVPGVRALPKPYDLSEAVEALNEALAG